MTGVDGSVVEIVEDFVLAPVTSVVLCLGRLLKHGWSLDRNPATGELTLKNADAEIPVIYRGELLACEGQIRAVSIRAVTLMKPLLKLREGWQEISPTLWALLRFSRTFIDTTTVPSQTVLWRRTTLVRQGGEWSLAEFGEDIREKSGNMTEDLPGDPEQIITLAHDDHLSPQELGFCDER